MYKRLSILEKNLFCAGFKKEAFLVRAMSASKENIENKVWKAKKILKLKDVDVFVQEDNGLDKAIEIKFSNRKKPVKDAKIVYSKEKLKKHIEDTGQDLMEIVCHELSHILAHNAGVSPDDEHEWLKKRYPEWAHWSDTISFPHEEWDDLKNRLEKGEQISTTRVSDEQGVYQRGQKYVTPWGATVRVTKVKTYKDLEKHPNLSELTDEQKKEVGKYRKFDVVWLK